MEESPKRVSICSIIIFEIIILYI